MNPCYNLLMALVRFGTLTQAVSGRVGSLCFARQGGSPIVRTQPLYRSRDSQQALQNRAYFSASISAWRALTDSQRLTWTQAARQFPTPNRLGLSRQLSGFALFVAARMRAYTANIGFFPFPSTGAGYTLGLPCTILIWPGGPAEAYLDAPVSGSYPFVSVQAQRLCKKDNTLPGRLLRTCGRKTTTIPSFNFWDTSTYMPANVAPGLIAPLGTPAALEWYLCFAQQWLPGYPRSITTSHLVQIPDVGANLVYNGDFEIDGATPPTGWEVKGTGLLSRTAAAYADGHSGKWLVAPGQAATYFNSTGAHRFALIGGQSYTLRWVYKVVSGNCSAVKIDGPIMTSYYPYSALPDTSGSWVRDEKHFTPDASDAAVYFQIYNNAATPCEIHFDNLSIRKDTP